VLILPFFKSAGGSGPCGDVSDADVGSDGEFGIILD